MPAAAVQLLQRTARVATASLRDLLRLAPPRMLDAALRGLGYVRGGPGPAAAVAATAKPAGSPDAVGMLRKLEKDSPRRA